MAWTRAYKPSTWYRLFKAICQNETHWVLWNSDIYELQTCSFYLCPLKLYLIFIIIIITRANISEYFQWVGPSAQHIHASSFTTTATPLGRDHQSPLSSRAQRRLREIRKLAEVTQPGSNRQVRPQALSASRIHFLSLPSCWGKSSRQTYSFNLKVKSIRGRGRKGGKPMNQGDLVFPAAIFPRFPWRMKASSPSKSPGARKTCSEASLAGVASSVYHLSTLPFFKLTPSFLSCVSLCQQCPFSLFPNPSSILPHVPLWLTPLLCEPPD